MERAEYIEGILNEVPPQPIQSGKLLRILGVGFGVAVGIGATVGGGIVRSCV